MNDTIHGGGRPTWRACFSGTGFLTSDSHDLLDNLTAISQGSLNARTFAYDSLSRITSATVPESGATYSYTTSGGALCSGDPSGICRKTDARNITTTYAYDALNRLTQKSYSDGVTPAANFLYDTATGWSNPTVTQTNLIGRLSEAYTSGSPFGGEVFDLPNPLCPGAIISRMKAPRIHRCVSLFLIMILVVPQSWATCGGGGGGGMGGMGGGMGAETYPVPWKIVKPEDTLKDGLAVYWLPSSQKELENSSLRFSQTLANYATQCVTMGILDQRMALGQKIAPGDKLPVAVLAQPDGSVVGKAENKNGFLKVDQVEKLLETEMKKRDEALKEKMESAKAKVKAGDKDGAVTEYRAVLDQKCLFPKRAKDAAKELKKLGVNDTAKIPDGLNFDPAAMARVDKNMRQGLKAENNANYTEAGRLYLAAHQIDPADPTPLRYLGELYRHHIGDWDKARQTFNMILAMPADPLSRAVALHGLGKITIHEGDFQKGLALMEQSVREYPLALAYRNLAVYWNSEGDTAKADFYTQEALKLEPKDPYNLVFAAAFMAGNGHADEALKIARENEALLPASYNLAAIYAQAGQKEKALALLQRHFYEYERYQAVRSKEMMEARVDAVFVSLMHDPSFMQLTSGADGRLSMRMGTGGKPAGN